MEKIYRLVGLDCEHCAKEIAQRLTLLPHVDAVEYTFGQHDWTIRSSKEIAVAKIARVVKSVRPTIEVGSPDDEGTDAPSAGDGYTKTHEHVHGHENYRQQHAHTAHDAAAHGHGHVHNESAFVSVLQKHIVWRMFFAASSLVALFIFRPTNVWEVVAYVCLYLFIGIDVIYAAAHNLLHGEFFDEMFLMSVATIGAFAIGEYPEAVVVMLFYQIGEYFQHKAVANSRKSIASLLDIRPDYANVMVGPKIERRHPEGVEVGELILVQPGERVPLDGVVVAGSSFVDTSALTGESVPREVGVDDEVLSGVINTNGVLRIRVSKPFGASTVAKILDLVEHAGTKKAPSEQFITKFSKYYTPVVVFTALGLATIPPLMFGFDTFLIWLERALTFLVISCPCALVISVPLGFFGGLGLASKNGILIKGGNFLEVLNDVDTVVFDKTGTLTKGRFALTEIIPAGTFSKEEVLTYATYAEWFSTHPIALAIKQEGMQIDVAHIKGYEEVAGRGAVLQIENEQVLVGNAKLMTEYNIVFEEAVEAGTQVYVAVNGTLVGRIVIADELKDDASTTIARLHARGVHTIMLSGDNEETVASVARKLSVEAYESGLLPQDKVASIERIMGNKKGGVMFVGDGMNDAPVLAQADIGVSMGGIGSDAAIEASDMVLMSDEPAKILTSMIISQKTKTIVWQNVIFALSVKTIVLLLGAVGYASMWAAVFADIGVSLLAIANSIRIIYLHVE